LVFSAFFAWISGGYFPSEFVISSGNELPKLFIFYGLGFAAIAFSLGLLFYYAYKLRDSINLNNLEVIITKYEVSSWLALGITAITSTLFAIVMPLNIAVYAGFVYTTLPFLMTGISFYYERKLRTEINRNKNEGSNDT
jgi:hypothetical protein